MRKRVKIIYIWTVMVLYCLFIGMYNSTAVCSPSLFSTAAGHESFAPATLSNAAHQSEQVEDFIHVCKNFPRTNLKNSFNQFSFSSPATIGEVNNSYASYIFYSENLFIRFKKTDIIFPFHNFW